MEDLPMTYSDSSAFEALTAHAKALPGDLASDQDALLSHLNEFFRQLSPSPVEAQIRRIDTLLQELQQFYPLTSGTFDAVLSVLELVFFHENTQELHPQLMELLGRICGTPSEELGDTQLSLICIRLLFPAIYDLGAIHPVRPCLYFMQPRKGLNQTFRYLYRRLEKRFPWELKLYELDRDFSGTQGYYANALYFIRDMATATAVFVHESNNLMGHLTIRPETEIIQLWHGCGVFKHIGLSTYGKDGFKSMEKYNEFPEYNNYSLVTIASPELEWVFEEFMGISKESHIIRPLGVSRTDEFFDPGYVEKCREKLYRAIPAAREKKVILYAPTYRGLDPNRVSPDALDIGLFAQELGDDYILILKHHQTVKQVPPIPEPYRDTFAYDMTRGKGMNINELMTIADVCITDYSSVAFEFSLFERPLLFFVYDLDDYIDNRGLYYNFDEITPGPLCRTTQEMADYIRSLKDGFDSTEISDFRRRFMCSCDGHASERTISFLIQSTHQSAELFRGLKPPAFKKDHHFNGWNIYRYEKDCKVWICTDDKWHTEQELAHSRLKKKRFDGEVTPAGVTGDDRYDLFYEALWKADHLPKAIVDYIRSWKSGKH
jgi:CDP-ribitol ribitolphosphotransferase